MVSQIENAGLSFDKLTEKQKNYFARFIWNGVGSRNFFINPHDLIFKEASLYHDFYYWRGGPIELKALADKDFFHRCHSAVRKQPLWKRPFYYFVAVIYYKFLALGKIAWEYGEKPCQTWQELLANFYQYHEDNPKVRPKPPIYRE